MWLSLDIIENKRHIYCQFCKIQTKMTKHWPVPPRTPILLRESDVVEVCSRGQEGQIRVGRIYMAGHDKHCAIVMRPNKVCAQEACIWRNKSLDHGELPMIHLI